MYMIKKNKEIKDSIIWLGIGLETCFNFITRGILTCILQKSTLKHSITIRK